MRDILRKTGTPSRKVAVYLDTLVEAGYVEAREEKVSSNKTKRIKFRWKVTGGQIAT